MVGCGGSTGSAASPQAGSNQDPQTIIAGAVLASQNIKSASGSFDVTVKLDADASKVPAEMKALVDNPIQVTGTFAAAQNPEAADLTVSLNLGGQKLDAALKSVDNKAWLQFGGQWYELPADMMGTTATTGASTSTSQPSLAEITKLLADLGIDPTTWITNLTIVGEEDIDGAASYHLKGTPDVAKMLTDLLQLMKSPEFTKLINPGGTGSDTSTTGGLDLQSMIPSPDQLQQMQTQLTEAFKNVTVEAWVGKADAFLRKVVLTANLTPPAGQPADGLSAINVTATISLQNFNQPVTVQAPASSAPITDLQKAIESNPQLLGPLGSLLGGLMGGTGTGGLGTDESTTSDTVTTN